MVYHIQGDILTSDCDVIGHQSNCRMGFGSGIAGQIRRKFPYAYEVFASDSRKPQDKLGSYCVSKEHRPYYIFNLYGQDYFGNDGNLYTDYTALQSALEQMMSKVVFWEINAGKLKVGLPYKIGCGLAGGDWEIVEDIIKKVSNDFKHDIYLYEFNP